MPRSLYTLLTWLVLPLVFLRLLWRARKAPVYRQRWSERIARYRAPLAPGEKLVLFHAVSVGEVHAARPLIERLQRERPALRILVTSTTPTGSARVREIFGAKVMHVYLPYDLPRFVDRFLDHFRPAVLVVLETELWPNLLHACGERGLPVILANARLSARSAGRYGHAPGMARELLGHLSLVAAQAEADGARFVALGLPEERLIVNGSLKFDVAIDEGKLAAARALKADWQRPVWIAASTREGEDAKVLRAFREVLAAAPQVLLVLVPRHPERFDEAAELAESLGLRVQRRSTEVDLAAGMQVLIGDTMGDMPFYYGLADVAFVGGSLVDTGCQNLIEPAALGLPVLSGPSLYNFQAVSDLLITAGGQQVVANETALAQAVLRLVGDPATARAMGSKARAVVGNNQGATERLCRMILERL